jgi:hypothetical protein
MRAGRMHLLPLPWSLSIRGESLGCSFACPCLESYSRSLTGARTFLALLVGRPAIAQSDAYFIRNGRNVAGSIGLIAGDDESVRGNPYPTRASALCRVHGHPVSRTKFETDGRSMAGKVDRVFAILSHTRKARRPSKAGGRALPSRRLLAAFVIGPSVSAGLQGTSAACSGLQVSAGLAWPGRRKHGQSASTKRKIFRFCFRIAIGRIDHFVTLATILRRAFVMNEDRNGSPAVPLIVSDSPSNAAAVFLSAGRAHGSSVAHEKRERVRAERGKATFAQGLQESVHGEFVFVCHGGNLTLARLQVQELSYGSSVNGSEGKAGPLASARQHAASHAPSWRN